MASLVVHVHDSNSEPAIASPKNTSTTPTSEDFATNAFFSKVGAQIVPLLSHHSRGLFSLPRSSIVVRLLG
uniref:Uncharacterized protein n=1 Tax=Picea sitchensis TaxID=3332 RepID=A9NVX7_PICSI|nr:unknown [Picea sitchensis]